MGYLLVFLLLLLLFNIVARNFVFYSFFQKNKKKKQRTVVFLASSKHTLTGRIKKIHMTSARMQYVLHTTLDQTRTLRVHVINVQLPLVRKHTTAFRDAQVFYSVIADGYDGRDHNVLSPTPFRLQPQTVARVRKLVRRMDHYLIIILIIRHDIWFHSVTTKSLFVYIYTLAPSTSRCPILNDSDTLVWQRNTSKPVTVPTAVFLLNWHPGYIQSSSSTIPSFSNTSDSGLRTYHIRRVYYVYIFVNNSK